jgi:hypothetical protein
VVTNVLYLLGLILVILGVLVLLGILAFGSASATVLFILGGLFILVAFFLPRRGAL